MNTAEVDRILRHTLEDFRLSRGEKQMLAALVEQIAGSDHELALLRSRVFTVALEHVEQSPSREVVGWLEEAVKTLQAPAPKSPTLPIEVYFSPGETCVKKIISMFHNVEQAADVCVFTITDDRISEAISAAHRRGVAIRILTDNDKANDLGSDVDRLSKEGIAVRYDRTEYHMHHKFAIFDGRRTLTGSYNWTRGAAECNEENFLVSHDPQLAATFATEFERLWHGLAP